jgi:hypothetical protein
VTLGETATKRWPTASEWDATPQFSPVPSGNMAEADRAITVVLSSAEFVETPSNLAGLVCTCGTNDEFSRDLGNAGTLVHSVDASPSCSNLADPDRDGPERPFGISRDPPLDRADPVVMSWVELADACGTRGGLERTGGTTDAFARGVSRAVVSALQTPVLSSVSFTSLADRSGPERPIGSNGDRAASPSDCGI